MKSGRTIVDQRSNNFGLWPLRFGIKIFSVFVPSAFVGNSDFCEVVFENGLVEMDDKLNRGSTPNVCLSKMLTHSLHCIRNLSKCNLLHHVLLHGQQCSLVDLRLLDDWKDNNLHLKG